MIKIEIEKGEGTVKLGGRVEQLVGEGTIAIALLLRELTRNIPFLEPDFLHKMILAKSLETLADLLEEEEDNE